MLASGHLFKLCRSMKIFVSPTLKNPPTQDPSWLSLNDQCPSLAGYQTVCRHLSDELDWVALCCLSKDQWNVFTFRKGWVSKKIDW